MVYWALQESIDGGMLLSDRYEILQYTDMDDIHEKPIYEGDILLHYDNINDSTKHIRVASKGPSFCGYWQSISPERHWRNYVPLNNFTFHGDTLEIIGNKFKDPNLLEVNINPELE